MQSLYYSFIHIICQYYLFPIQGHWEAVGSAKIHWAKQNIHVIHTCRPVAAFSSPDLYFCGWWEDTGAPGGDPQCCSTPSAFTGQPRVADDQYLLQLSAAEFRKPWAQLILSVYSHHSTWSRFTPTLFSLQLLLSSIMPDIFCDSFT